jgi:DnaJ family protein C protein 28
MPSDQDTASKKEELRRQYQQEQAGETGLDATRDWQNLIEEQIAKIDWSTVQGKGKPLNLDRNPYADPGDELAHGLLKNAGFTLPWIEDSKKIDADVAAVRVKLARAHAGYLEARDAEMCSGHQWIEGAWLAAVREFRQEATRINREIRDFNLKAPSAHLHKFALRIDEELAPYGADDD